MAKENQSLGLELGGQVRMSDDGAKKSPEEHEQRDPWERGKTMKAGGNKR